MLPDTIRVEIKFGIDIPDTKKEVVRLEGANANTLWQDAIKLDMKNSHGALKLCDTVEKAPVGNTKST